MTIRKTATISSQRVLVLGALMASLAGCGMISSITGGDKVDYKASKKAQPLDVPPDLTQLQKDNRYAVPDNANGVATASGYNAQKAGAAAAPAAALANDGVAVVPTDMNSIKVERSGNTRWLVVKQTPEQLWPQLKAFWKTAVSRCKRKTRRPASWKPTGMKTAPRFLTASSARPWASCSTTSIRAARWTSSAPASSACPTAAARSTSATAARRKW